jgi:hypothetical protein
MLEDTPRFSLLLLLAWLGSASGAIVWSISPDGDETLRSALAQMQEGDEIVIKGGWYTGRDSCGLTVARDNVVVRGDPDEEVLIDCGGISRHFTILGNGVSLVDIHFFNGSSAVRPEDQDDHNQSRVSDGGCALVLGEDSSFVRVKFSYCSTGVNASGGSIR